MNSINRLTQGIVSGSLEKIPTTPDLTKAYGSRASEIAKELWLDDQDRKSYQVFATRAGPDATSL